MQRFLDELRTDLKKLDSTHMRRSLMALPSSRPVVGLRGRKMVNLASNDYLGLSYHPRLKKVAIDAITHSGTGAGASRLITGNLDIHESTENKFAHFKHMEAALLLPTGYMSNLAVLTALAKTKDLICIDKLSHASLIDAARATNADVRSYPHLKTDKLKRLLARHTEVAHHTFREENSRAPRRFIVTDSVFSMDGDAADLPGLCDLAERYDAVLVVDEAHATGVLGSTGAGLCELQNVCHRVHIITSTASKALGGSGGIVTAARDVIDTIINYARSFIYTTACPPSQAATISAALDVLREESWRRVRLAELSKQVYDTLIGLGWQLPVHQYPTPIFPLIVKTPQAAISLAKHMMSEGILVTAIRPPTVPPNSSRVRISLRADLEDEHIDIFLKTIGKFDPSRTDL